MTPTNSPRASAEQVFEGMPLDYLCGGDFDRCQCFYHLGCRRVVAALCTARSRAFEEAAEMVEKMRGGYTAGLIENVLIPDKDGPWILNHEVAATLRRKAGEKET